MSEYFSKYRLLLINIAIWVLAGAYLGGISAIIASGVGFLLLVRQGNHGAILMGLLCMLIFSDSRSAIFQFAAQAKIIFTLISMLFILSQLRNMPVNSKRIFDFFLPFIVYAMILTPFANDTFDAFQKTVSYAVIFLIVPVFFTQASKNDERFTLDFVLFIFIVLLLGLILRLTSPEFVTLAERYRGMLGNPNGLGIFLTLVFPIAYLILEKGSIIVSVRNKWIFYGVIVFSLLLCQSRTAFLACGLFLMFNSLPSLRGGLGLVVFLVIIFSYEYLLSKIPVLIMALNLGEYFRIDTLLEGSGRLVAWQFAWEQIQHVFFFGGGFDYTNDLYKQYFDYLSRLGHQGNAHNSFLTLWLDTGIVGLTLFSVGLIRTIFYTLGKTNLTLPVIYGILFSTNFESWLAASLNPFTSLFLVALTLLSNPQLLQRKTPEPIVT